MAIFLISKQQINLFDLIIVLIGLHRREIRKKIHDVSNVINIDKVIYQPLRLGDGTFLVQITFSVGDDDQ